MTDGMNRRRFLKVLGVTGGGAAAMSGCSTDTAEKLIPYLIPPENEIPGVATYYASTCRECPAGCGVHVRVREGRAVKVEGNPENPINRGKLCARAQATLQGTYNPDRIRAPMARGSDGSFEPISWDDALSRIVERLGSVPGDQVWFLTGNEKGTFDRLISEWLAAIGSSGRVVYEPFGYEALRYANREVFGLDAIPWYDFASARFVVSFGADFLETWLNPVEQARNFANGHSYRDGQMGKFVHIEPRMSMTAISADEWIAPIPGSEALVALAMAQVILAEGLGTPPSDARRLTVLLNDYEPAAVAGRCGVSAEAIDRLAREFAADPSLAVAGGIGAQHEQAHATAAAVNILNYVTGNVGRTVQFGPDLDPAGGSSYSGVVELVEAMSSDRVGVLFVHGTNPAYSTPPGLGFAGRFASVGLKVSFSRFFDETTMLADLVLPDLDPLEQWNDFEPREGFHLLQQPVMQRVFPETRQTGDVILDLARKMGGRAAARLRAADYKEYLQRSWRALQRRLGDRRPFETFWTDALRQGGAWREVRARRVRLAASASRLQVETWAAPPDSMTLMLYPSTALYDGRTANRPWLQELPDPVTKITWNSWVEINPATAGRLGISEGDVLEITSETSSLRAPAYPHPGIREDVLAMPLGQGHTAFGRYAKDRGANPLALLSATATEFGGLAHYAAVDIRNTGEHVRFAKTEGRRTQMDRGVAQATTLAAAAAGLIEKYEPEHAARPPHHEEQTLDDVAERQRRDTERRHYAGEHPRWGMAIDLSRCTGCSACVTACNAENNIPYVGEDAVRHGRDISWMRIERYFEGGEGGDPPEARVVPMLCQQCGNAPCEPVCPVFATYQTPDGLNAQVYNRCVGTRYCSNNCPYKVRYFNWFDHQNPKDEAFAWADPLHWLLNPDVTVRSKGVMEKCTFCVQRIRGAQHQATMENRELRDGEILTACQQTCPADAIVFGDRNDPDSRVAQLSRDERGYHVLGSLNTKPAITYLMKVRNLAEA